MSLIRNKSKETLYIFVFVFLFFFLIELLFFGLFSITGSKYFGTIKSPSEIIRIVGGSDSCSNFNASEVNQLKIAVFGGSTSLGYASPISFSDILCNYEN